MKAERLFFDRQHGDASRCRLEDLRAAGWIEAEWLRYQSGTLRTRIEYWFEPTREGVEGLLVIYRRGDGFKPDPEEDVRLEGNKLVVPSYKVKGLWIGRRGWVAKILAQCLGISFLKVEVRGKDQAFVDLPAGDGPFWSKVRGRLIKQFVGVEEVVARRMGLTTWYALRTPVSLEEDVRKELERAKEEYDR